MDLSAISPCLFAKCVQLFQCFLVPSYCFNLTKPNPDGFKEGLVERFNDLRIKSAQRRLNIHNRQFIKSLCGVAHLCTEQAKNGKMERTQEQKRLNVLFTAAD